MRFKKRPTVVEVMQFTGENVEEIKSFTEAKFGDAHYNGKQLHAVSLTLYLGNYCLSLSSGDWVWRNVHVGGWSQCDPLLFAALYEPETETP